MATTTGEPRIVANMAYTSTRPLYVNPINTYLTSTYPYYTSSTFTIANQQHLGYLTETQRDEVIRRHRYFELPDVPYCAMCAAMGQLRYRADHTFMIRGS